jgi:hypothetical protein
MCNINSKTDLKTKTIYKAVKKYRGRYFSYFSGFEIKLGPVDLDWKVTKLAAIEGLEERNLLHARPYNPTMEFLYNENMVGKTSGFGEEKWAKHLAFGRSRYHMKEVHLAILKIKLGGEIWEGTAAKIGAGIPVDIKTYAGTEILSFEELFSKPSHPSEVGYYTKVIEI